MLFMVLIREDNIMLESINPWAPKRPSRKDYPLPDLFRFGTDDNTAVGEVLETGAIIGSGLIGAYKIFNGLTDFNEYMAHRNMYKR